MGQQHSPRFRKYVFSWTHFLKNIKNMFHFRIDFSWNSITFSASMFAFVFFIDFSWKWLPKRSQKASRGSSKIHTFRDLLFYLDFMLILCWFYVDFGSLWAPFLVPLAPFWLTFGVPWLTFGALSFTFAHPGIHFLTFAVSCPHFSYLFEFSMKISCKIWFLNHFLWKSHSRSIKSYFPEAHRTHPNRKYIFSCNPPFKGPERNICRRQLRLTV